MIKNVYVHIPFCIKKCFYCDFPVYALGKKFKMDEGEQQHVLQIQEKYIEYLLKEIDLTFQTLRQYNQEKMCVETLYIGGGTPSLISVKEIQRILGKFEFSQVKNEVSIECDPGTFDKQKIQDYVSIGINRLSIGVQSFDEGILREIGRSHQLKDILSSFEILQNVNFFSNFDKISVDLLMGIPSQTLQQYTESLNKVLFELRPGHISTYVMEWEPGSFFTRKKKLKTEPKILKEMYFLTGQTLQQYGYSHYEISSFAREFDLQSKHNSIYWEGSTEFLGFGMGAASFFLQNRFTRPKTLQQYFKFVKDFEMAENKLEFLSGQGEKEARGSLDSLKSVLMGQLRTKKGINLYQIQQQFNGLISADEILEFFSPYLEYDNLLEVSSGLSIALKSPEGFYAYDDLIPKLFQFVQEK